MDSNKDLSSLLEKLKNGEQAAFDELYNRCYGHILFVSSKLCDNKEDAEEVAQDTFVIAFKKANELRADTLMAYLRRIAANQCYHKRKKNNRIQEHTVHSDDYIESYEEIDTDFLPEKYLQNKESQAELLRVIEELPKSQQEMIYLYYYVDISTQEISRLLACSADNVYKTLSRARQTIKSKLEGTDNKKPTKLTASASLASVLFIEEEIFAASYTNTALASTLDVAGKTAVAASSTTTVGKVCAIGAGIAVVGAVCVGAYLALVPDTEIYEPPEPVASVTIPISEYVHEPAQADIPDDVSEEIPETQEPDEPPEEILPAIPPEPPTQAYERHAEYVVSEPETYIAAALILEDISEEEEPQPLEEPEPYEPQEDIPYDEPPEPPEPYEPEQPPLDRTPEIMAALAAASASADVSGIISRYGFAFTSQVQRSTGGVFRFYVANEGSGDILIGIATDDDGGDWRMRFALYNNGQRPSDTRELFRWMEE